jgi:hypothetical protein
MLNEGLFGFNRQANKTRKKGVRAFFFFAALSGVFCGISLYQDNI